VTRPGSAVEVNGVSAPTSIESVHVTIGGQAAYVGFVSPTQINAQVPADIGAGTQSLVVSTPGGLSQQFMVSVKAAQPGLLAPAGFKLAGKQYVGALLADGVTYVMPPASVGQVPSRQARPGETIVMYGVGFGAVDSGVGVAGQVVQQTNSLTTTPLTILFGQTPATVSYAGLSPGAIGLYQINVVVPAVPDSDAVALSVTLGGVAGSQTLFTAVKR